MRELPAAAAGETQVEVCEGIPVQLGLRAAHGEEDLALGYATAAVAVPITIGGSFAAAATAAAGATAAATSTVDFRSVAVAAATVAMTSTMTTALVATKRGVTRRVGR